MLPSDTTWDLTRLMDAELVVPVALKPTVELVELTSQHRAPVTRGNVAVNIQPDSLTKPRTATDSVVLTRPLIQQF
jgi:hypothetical protein